MAVKSRSMFAPRVVAIPGRDALVYIVGAAKLQLWHLSVHEAQSMTGKQLAAELEYAAKSNGVALGDLWAAYRTAVGGQGQS
jgi:hypothetical protein